MTDKKAKHDDFMANLSLVLRANNHLLTCTHRLCRVYQIDQIAPIITELRQVADDLERIVNDNKE